MSKFYKLSILLLSLFLSSMLIFNNNKINAKSDLDLIELYEIKVDPRRDGTLDMEYHFIWKVLDDKSEGPMSWVRIGVANYYVSEFKALSDNIVSMEYSSDDGSHIEIHFNKSYYENDICDFRFSFHQSRIYTLKNGKCQYQFLNGYFDEIRVEKYVIRWNSANVEYTNIDTRDGEYIYFESPLSYGERVNIEVSYPMDVFEGLSKKSQYSKRTMTNREIILLSIALSIIGLGLGYGIFLSIRRRINNEYLLYRGFTGDRIHIYPGYSRINSVVGVDSKGKRIINPISSSSSSGGHSSGGGCACACACACAGGGRAGCTRKDFYHTNLSVEELKSELNK